MECDIIWGISNHSVVEVLRSDPCARSVSSMVLILAMVPRPPRWISHTRVIQLPWRSRRPGMSLSVLRFWMLGDSLWAIKMVLSSTACVQATARGRIPPMGSGRSAGLCLIAMVQNFWNEARRNSICHNTSSVPRIVSLVYVCSLLSFCWEKLTACPIRCDSIWREPALRYLNVSQELWSLRTLLRPPASN